MQSNESKKTDKKNIQGQTNLRLWFVLVPFFIVLFVILIYRLFQLQIVEGDKYRGMALQQRTRQDVLTAKRGAIYDRNNKVLAQSNTVWNVCISPAELDPELLPQVAEELGAILDVSPQVIIDAAKTTTAEGALSLHAWIKRKIESGLKEEVQAYLDSFEKKIRWIYFEEDTKRYYIYDNLASSILGYTNNESEGAYGIESYYNRTLSGTAGIEVTTKNAWGSNMPDNVGQMYEAKDGNSLVLTIDETIQSILEKHLEMANIEHNVQNKSAAIMMNIETGEILGMATKSDFNPNDPRTIVDQVALDKLSEEFEEGSEEYEEEKQNLMFKQWRNKAISDPYEPGSVYKIITAAIALENQLTYLEEPFYCPGYFEVSGERINCWLLTGHGQQTLMDGMRNSCNPVFLELGLRIGAETTQEALTNFGFGKLTGIDLPGEANGILHAYSVLSSAGKIDLANTSFGQSFKATPIQLATAIGAALNGGKLMEPYVVKQIIDSQGNVVETTEPIVKRQVVSEQTSEVIRHMIESVVTEGTGSKAAVPGYRIGGKTGTSQKLDLLPKSKEYVLSFAGFAPMDDPTYLVLVILDEPQIANAVSSVIAAPVVGAIMQEALPYLGLEPQYTALELEQEELTVPYLINAKPHDAQAELTTAGFKTNLIGSGGQVLRQIPQAGQKASRGSVITLYTEEEAIEEGIELPNFVGMTVEEAQKQLAKLGLNVEWHGVADAEVNRVVSEQWPLPNTECNTGDIILLTLKEAVAEEKDVLPEITIDPPEDSQEDDTAEE